MARITVEIADEAAASLRSVVAASGVDEASVIETALLLYGEQAAGFRAFVAEGEADVAAGRVVPMEDAFAEAQAIIEKARQRVA
jgi:predicted transcriptional regulator